MSYSRLRVYPFPLLGFPSTGQLPRGTVVAGCPFVTYPDRQPGIWYSVHERVHLASEQPDSAIR